jgi:hypothetical protein
MDRNRRDHADAGDVDASAHQPGECRRFNPHAAQTARGHDERIGVSSGSQSAFVTALWLHHPDVQ